ncbi:MAG: acyl-CoA thioesterase [Gemmatimonadales bacterium]
MSQLPTTETTIAVRSGEIDSFGHVNHAVFLHYFEHARYEALQAAGFRWHLLRDNDWQIYVVRIEVDYVAQAMRGDTLRVRTWAESFRRTTMTLRQEMLRDQDGSPVVVARAKVDAVWIGPDRRPMRVPEIVRAGLSAAV